MLITSPKEADVAFCVRKLKIANKHASFLVSCAYLFPAINHPDGQAGWVWEMFSLGRLLALIIDIMRSAPSKCLVLTAELIFITLTGLIFPKDLCPEGSNTSLCLPLSNRLTPQVRLSEFWGHGL
ncbi:hypothetical protein MJO28_013469 [Puccinia striiformis f. sp. tritici]|uniref:Uncharacterized protein n=1 Tax=Puccinia striiformis f. sp. tritici TaxID=168172 RepID=A0ACC0DYP8_9BASI|nr:hypothetical protein MJO28_013469 [Puccinia striiformis f. sp. tritici]